MTAKLSHEEQLAFPSDMSDGMTLRDYFAGQALASMDAGTKKIMHASAVEAGEDMTASIATACYELADAMLAERERAK